MYELTHIGLDVHKDTIAVAVLRRTTEEGSTCSLMRSLTKALERAHVPHCGPSTPRWGSC